MVAKAIKRKKNTKTLKEELVKLLRESDTVEQSGFDTKNTVDQQQAINKIKHYDNTIKTGNKNTIRYESIERQILQKFKNTEGLVEKLGLSRSRIYFNFLKFLKKYLA